MAVINKDLYDVIIKLNKLAMYVGGYVLGAKLLEAILRYFKLNVLAFFPTMAIEVVLSLVEIFAIPLGGIYIIAFIGYLISRHSN